MTKRTRAHPQDAAALLGTSVETLTPRSEDLRNSKVSETAGDTTATDMRVTLDRVDIVDEKFVERLEAQKREEGGLREDQKTPGQMLRSLTPDQKEAVFRTYKTSKRLDFGSQDPMFIARDAVPDSVKLHWLSVNLVPDFGMRGYRRVRYTPETQKWVPNAIQLGSTEHIVHGNYFLGMKDMDTYFEDEVLRYRMTHDILEQEDERFRSMLHEVPGLRDAAKGQGSGFIATRGADPGSPSQPDLVSGDGDQ